MKDEIVARRDDEWKTRAKLAGYETQSDTPSFRIPLSAYGSPN